MIGIGTDFANLSGERSYSLSYYTKGALIHPYGRVRSAEGLSPHREISPRSDMAALPQQGAAPLAPLRGYPYTPTKTVHPPLASVPFLRVLLSYPGGDTHSPLACYCWGGYVPFHWHFLALCVKRSFLHPITASTSS